MNTSGTDGRPRTIALQFFKYPTRSIRCIAEKRLRDRLADAGSEAPWVQTRHAAQIGKVKNTRPGQFRDVGMCLKLHLLGNCHVIEPEPVQPDADFANDFDRRRRLRHIHRCGLD
ncbi:MAG: hypothetical protein ACFHWZ_13795 [Phycisphaerales bacterium]